MGNNPISPSYTSEPQKYTGPTFGKSAHVSLYAATILLLTGLWLWPLPGGFLVIGAAIFFCFNVVPAFVRWRLELSRWRRRQKKLHANTPQALYVRGDIDFFEFDAEVERQLEAGLDGEQPMHTAPKHRFGRPPGVGEDFGVCSNPNCDEPSLSDGFCALPHGRREARAAEIHGWRNPCLACGTREHELMRETNLCHTCENERLYQQAYNSVRMNHTQVTPANPDVEIKAYSVPPHIVGDPPKNVDTSMIVDLDAVRRKVYTPDTGKAVRQ